MTEWVDVVDTAVKIGLGALIGGGFSVWLQISKNNSVLTLEKFKRKREIIEEILDTIEAFQENILNYGNAVAKAKDHGLEATEELHKYETSFFNQLPIMDSLKGKLYLLEEGDIVDGIDAYISIIGDFYIGIRKSLEANTPYSDEWIQNERRKQRMLGKKIIEGLSVAYNKHEK